MDHSNIFLLLSLACFVLSVLAAFRIRSVPKTKIKVFHCIFVGVLFASFFAFLPISILKMENATWPLNAVFLSFYYTFQVFTVGAEGQLILDTIKEVGSGYGILLSALYVAAPILTFGFLAFLFRNLLSSLRFALCKHRELYIFSALNIRSATLAEDIRRLHKHASIVFTDIFANDDETTYELTEKCRRIHAICFKRDLQALPLHKYKHKAIHIFIMDEDERENVTQSIRLMEHFKTMKNIHLYVFTTNVESQILLTHTKDCAMTVRRINIARTLVYRFIDEEGIQLFRNAKPNCYGTKTVHAVILGLGRYGREMLKALSWYCQMDGYRLEIDAYDSDPLAEDRISALCPELLSPARNGVEEDGESLYTIRIHSGVATGTKTFADSLSKLRTATFAFVALGTDEENINAATELRMIFSRSGIDADIQAVVYGLEDTGSLQNARNFKNQPYQVSFIGDISGTYTEASIIHSRLDYDALQRHLQYDPNGVQNFWQHEYNYRSSIASAIHIQARYLCGLPGANKAKAHQTPAEREALRKLEHLRWNAYTRSEGYIYSGSMDKASRFDLAKKHNYLVNYYDLPESVKQNDECDGVTDPSMNRSKYKPLHP